MNKPCTGEKYRHFKGMTVEIVCVAKDTETLEEKVVYLHDNEFWVRPMEMFLSKVDKEKYPEIIQEYRFEKVED